MPTARKPAELTEHEDRLVSVNALHFDPINPRGKPEQDEVKIRNAFAVLPETLMLATHMAEHGQNPLDRMGVVGHPKLPGHYVVREGNRRLAATQLLRDPERAPTPAFQKQYQRLAKEGRPLPDEQLVVLFHEKPRARVWMSVKHEGEQGGLGTKPWGADEKARFNREGGTSITRPKNPNRQAEALLTYAVAQRLITAEQRGQIAITTITRYLPNIRKALALLNNEDCTTNANQEEFNAAVQRFLSDAIDDRTADSRPAVNSRSIATERDNYGETLRRENVAPITRDLPPYDPSEIPPAKPSAKKAPVARNARDYSKRKHLILKNFINTSGDPVLLNLVKEGREMNPDVARFSCNYLNRVILERLVHLYAKGHGVGGQGTFDEVMQRIINHAKASVTPPTKNIVHILTKAADKKTAYSYEIMSNAVHGGNTPTGADNRTNWENLQPALEYLLSQLK
jgi:hypothetical protein